MPKLIDLFAEVSVKGITQVKQGLDQVDGIGKAVSKTMQMVQTAIMGIGGYQVINALKTCITTFTEYTEKIDAANKMTGISTDQLQKLKYAADQEAASFEQVMHAIKILTHGMTEAMTGNDEMLRWFDAMDVSVKNADGSMRKAEDVFYDIVDAINRLGSDTEKTAATLKFFGKSGDELLPFIKLGKEGLKAYGDEAERLGTVMSEDMIRQGEAFGDTMKQLDTQLNFLKMTVADALMPTLNDLTMTMSELATHKDLIYALVDLAKAGAITPAAIVTGKMDRELMKQYIEHKRIEIEADEKAQRLFKETWNNITKEWGFKRDIAIPTGKILTEQEKEELRIKQEVNRLLKDVQMPMFEHEIDSRNRLEKLRDNFLIQEAQLAEELPENRVRFEEWYETQVKIVNFMQSFLTPIFTDFYATLAGGEMTWEEFGNSAVSALKRIAFELMAVATVGMILDALGLGGVVRTLGALGGLFQTPSGDWWAQKEGYDMAKFFGLGFQQSLSNMVHAATPQNEPMMLYIEAEPGIIVRKMARMSLGHKRKFNKSVIKYTENRE